MVRQGVQPGERVAVLSRSSWETVVMLVTSLRSGFVYVPINPGYQEDELQHVLDDSGASVLFVDGFDGASSDVLARVRRPMDLRLVIMAGEEASPLPVPQQTLTSLLRDAPDNADAAALPGDDDLAMLIYTSGTTGRSKGCMHTYRSLDAGISALMQLWQVSPSDHVVNALPLFHVHGLCVAMLGALQSGATVELLRFSAEGVLDACARGGTVFMSVPTMVTRILALLDKHPSAASAFLATRLFTCGSAALFGADLLEFEGRTGLRILERYGMSESLITLSNPLDGERREGTVGRPVPGTDIRVVDDELQVAAPGLMQGYWQRPAQDAEVLAVDPDGRRWLRTGDIVRVDDDGYVRIVGRASQDILKVAGYKLSTREIEEALATHPAVADVAVVGVLDAEWGERVVACVVPAPSWTGPLDDRLLADLQRHVRLQEAKKPRGLHVVDALPRNALGKVQKHVLKEQLKGRSV